MQYQLGIRRQVPADSEKESFQMNFLQLPRKFPAMEFRHGIRPLNTVRGMYRKTFRPKREDKTPSIPDKGAWVGGGIARHRRLCCLHFRT